jgi:hypothetical protein
MPYRVTEADYKAESKRQQTIIDSTNETAAAKLKAQVAWLKNQINYENFKIQRWNSENAATWNSFRWYVAGGNGDANWNPFRVKVSPRWEPIYVYNGDIVPDGSSYVIIRNPSPTGTTDITFDSYVIKSGTKTWGQYAADQLNIRQAADKATVDGKKTKIQSSKTKIENFTDLLSALEVAGKPYTAKEFDKLETGTIPATETTDATALHYNCAFPKETYFASNQFFYYNDGKNNVMHGNNTPTKISKSPLTELWKDSSNKVAGHKGMIIPNQSYFKASAVTKNPNNAITPQDKNGYTIDTFTDNVAYNGRVGGNYAFQFMYNPGSIQMSYMGTPDVDVGFEISGSEQFGLIGGIGVTQSTITFDILLNRTFDMTYIDPKTKKLKKGFKVTDIYPAGSNLPTDDDLELIYHRGTMYDVEFLLRGLLGYVATTTLRSFLSTSGINQSKTADIGYLGAMPVELHLGESLRYLGIINGLGIQHVMFNERMVPTFSTLRIQFNRIPDFPTTL